MYKHLVHVMAILFPSVALAFDVPIKLALDPPTEGMTPTFYTIYLCDQPISSRFSQGPMSEIPMIGVCTGKLTVQITSETTVELKYPTESQSGTIYARASSGAMEQLPSGTSRKLESELSNEVSMPFANEVVIKPPTIKLIEP